MKKNVRNNPVNTKVREGGGKEGAAGARAEIPAACGEDHVEAGCLPANIMEDYVGADIHTVACSGLHAATGRWVQLEATACGEPLLERGKSVRRKELQRGVMDCSQHPFPIQLCY